MTRLRKPSLVLLGLVGVLVVIFLAGLQAGLLVLIGIGFGLILQACRFGFTSGWRHFILRREAAGITGQMLLMAVASAVALPLLSLYPTEIFGAVAPISWSLLLGAFVFGVAMQVADGCGSGSLNRAGAGAALSWVVLPTFIAGSFIGASHQPAWLALGGPLDALSSDPGQGFSLDFLQQWGLGPSLIITLAGCAVVVWLAWQAQDRAQHRNLGAPLSNKLVAHWLLGGLLLALLYGVHLIVAGQPWGIVYGLGLWGAKAAVGLGIDLGADPFWSASAHAQRLIEPILWDITSLTNIGLLFGAMAAARWGMRATTSPGSRLLMHHWVAGALAGLVMGYSARLAFGCNIGGFLGGVASASLHGWVWFAMAYLGSILGVRLRLKLDMP
jgi:hypothetical protein